MDVVGVIAYAMYMAGLIVAPAAFLVSLVQVWTALEEGEEEE